MLDCATATSTVVSHMKVLLLKPIIKFDTKMFSYHFRGVIKGCHKKGILIDIVQKGERLQPKPKKNCAILYCFKTFLDIK